MKKTISLKLTIAVLLLQISFISPPIVSAQKGVGNLSIDRLPSKEKRWALIIGIDEYINDVSTLKGSVNDAKALKNVLVNYAGFPEKQIVLLTTDSAEQEKRPTRENILGALNDLYSRVPEDGLLLFSFSGHGISVGNQAFLIPSNGRFTKNPELLQDFSIDVSRIKRAIETMKVKQVLMLLDACRNEPGKGDVPNPLTNTLAQGFSFDVANSDVKAFATLYATSIGERAYEFYDKETKQFRGYFSHAVEEALKGKAANEKGEVTLSALINYLETTVPKKVKYDKGETQIPMANYSETYKANNLLLSLSQSQNQKVSASNNPKQETIIKNSIGMELIFIPPGEYMMGTSDEEAEAAYKEQRKYESYAKRDWFDDEKPKHKVVISTGFYMGRYEVTQAQYKKLMGNNPSRYGGCDNCPVENLSWTEAKEFIRILNEKNEKFLYRLPSESEWEYACRAGTTTAFSFGNDLSSSEANFNGLLPYGNALKKENEKKILPVGSFKPNEFGLYDMHGNVSEWCEDIYAESYNGLPNDGSPNLIGGSGLRVDRGGSWLGSSSNLRSASRNYNLSYSKDGWRGFRLVAVAKK